jgi:hypothetical protein
MEVKAFCSNMKGEVASWRTKTQELMGKMYRESSGPVEGAAGSIAKFDAMIKELERGIGQLEANCPANWDKERAYLERIISEMNEIWQETWQKAGEMSPDDF